MTDLTLTARITDAHKKIHEAWLAARTQYPTQPPHPVTTLCAAALAQIEKACAAVACGGADDARAKFAADMGRLEKSDPSGAQWVEHILTERIEQQPEDGDRG